MNLRTLTNLVAATALALLVTACSNGSSSSPNPPNNAISIAFATQPVTSLTAGKATSITAIVSNDNSNAGVKWSVSCSGTGSACGSLSAATSASGTAVTYTAPTSVPLGGGIVNVVATAAADSTQSVTGTITVTAVPQAVLNDGSYVYHATGWDANGPVYLAGAFVVKNTVITGGEQDFTDSNGVGHTDQINASGSTLSAAGGNIQVTLATTNPNIGVSGTEVFRGNKVSNSRFLITEFDTSAAVSGSIDLQTNTAMPTGGYAFGLNGQDTAGNPLVIGGILNFSGTSLVVANSVFDYNDGGAVGQAQTFASGSISAPDSFGRSTISLTPTGVPNGAVSQFSLAAYVIGNGQLQIVESGSDVLQATLGGLALSQGNNVGHFTAAGITGTSYAYYASGFSTKNYLVIGGGFGFNSDGTISGAMVYNDFESPVGNQITAGTYTISPLGRVTIIGAVPQPLNLILNFQFYLDGRGNAIELGVDGNQVSEGPSFLQQAPGSTYNGTYAIAPQGVLDIQGNPVPWGSVGPMTVTLGNISGYTDYNAAGTPTSNVALGGIEDSTDGLFHISGLNAGDFGYVTGWGYYPVDANRVILIETDKNAVSTMMLESNGTTANSSPGQ
jgi:hypothetical protein